MRELKLGKSRKAIRGLAIAVAATAMTAVSAASATAAPASAPASLVTAVTHVPTSATDAVGKGGGQVVYFPEAIPGTALIADGKPEMLYIGAWYCPFGGAETWPMIVALSRFGRFSGLSTTRSSATDVYSDTPSWKFYGSTFTSKYVTFIPVEMYTNIPDPNGYTTLQKLTPAQNALFAKWDAPPYVSAANRESFPFIDFGNKYLEIGSSYDPQVLSGLSWTQIAADLSQPRTQVAKAVDGTANYITAALCKLTRNRPSTACTSVIRSLEASLPTPKGLDPVQLGQDVVG